MTVSCLSCSSLSLVKCVAVCDFSPLPCISTAEDAAEIDQLRRRLEETERAMERIMKQMSTVSEKLNVAKITSNIKTIKQVSRFFTVSCSQGLSCQLTQSSVWVVLWQTVCKTAVPVTQSVGLERIYDVTGLTSGYM